MQNEPASQDNSGGSSGADPAARNPNQANCPRLLDWAEKFLGPRELNKIDRPYPANLPNLWAYKGSGCKALSWEIDPGSNVDCTTVLGGICSIFSGDEAALGSGSFASLDKFEDWLRTWYPRIDQVHDCVGIPPRGTKRVLYVCEDSLFARRLSGLLGFTTEALSALLRRVHEEQGSRAIENWLALGGYHGRIEVVYTSDLEPKLDVALRAWERMLGWRFKPRERDRAKVNLMYTPLWLDVLGVEGPALIYEPANHGLEWDWNEGLKLWERKNPYARPGFCEQLSVIGFMPFATAGGLGRNLSHNQVPNRGNWRDFCPAKEDAWWYALNFFPANTLKRSAGNELDQKEVQKRTRFDLRAVFEGSYELRKSH